ncbi:MAG: Holliday junction branch migration protein RuvA [Gammaproteobacteria bacterium]|nr:MAG: Holliday junction branch migration protein RuvA [Gammaproteobacteria bacterium]
MIGSLRGKLTAREPTAIIIECAGVGYEVATPMSTFLELPQIGEDVFLYMHLLVRENDQNLYGFATDEEKHLFRTLLKISGVGAKMGLAILSAMTVRDFERCVQTDDAAMLIKIPGVGKKTAERLIIEMRDKIDKAPLQVVAARADGGPGDPRSLAVDALVSLGYKLTEVKRLLAQIDPKDKSAEDIIRLALRHTVS